MYRKIPLISVAGIALMGQVEVIAIMVLLMVLVQRKHKKRK